MELCICSSSIFQCHLSMFYTASLTYPSIVSCHYGTFLVIIPWAAITENQTSKSNSGLYLGPTKEKEREAGDSFLCTFSHLVAEQKFILPHDVTVWECVSPHSKEAFLGFNPQHHLCLKIIWPPGLSESTFPCVYWNLTMQCQMSLFQSSRTRTWLDISLS